MRDVADTTCRVGVIDDDPGIRRSLSRLLRVAGFDVIVFDSAEGFLESPERFECLVVDVQLPGKTGIELARDLERTGRARPTIFITSHEDYLAAAVARPGQQWLRKPFEATDLIAAIERLVDVPSS